MFKVLAFMVAIFGLTVFSGGYQGKNSQNEKDSLAGIRELHRKDIDASKARNFETLLSLWTEDGVLLEPGKKPIIGKEAVKAYMDEQAKISKTYMIKKYEHKWEEIKVIGNWAFEWGFFEVEAEMKEGGKLIGFVA